KIHYKRMVRVKPKGRPRRGGRGRNTSSTLNQLTRSSRFHRRIVQKAINVVLMKVPKSATAVSQPADVDELLAQHSSCVDPAGSWYVTGSS
ncbi:hypothetical protein GN958_ATG02437, partial [Phytophthora infestans]